MSLREELQRGIYAYGYVCVQHVVSGTRGEGRGCKMVPYHMTTKCGQQGRPLTPTEGYTCRKKLISFTVSLSEDVMLPPSSRLSLVLRSHQPFNRGRSFLVSKVSSTLPSGGQGPGELLLLMMIFKNKDDVICPRS